MTRDRTGSQYNVLEQSSDNYYSEYYQRIEAIQSYVTRRTM